MVPSVFAAPACQRRASLLPLFHAHDQRQRLPSPAHPHRLDWPAPGAQFRDITPLLQDPKVFRILIDAFVHRYMDPDMRPMS